MIRRTLIISTLSLFLAYPASAQDAGTGITTSSNTLAFTTTPKAIGQATCSASDADGLGQTIYVKSDYSTSTDDGKDRNVGLVFYTDADCLDSLPTTSCPSVQVDPSGDGICGCLYTWPSARSDNTLEFRLSDSVDSETLEADVCGVAPKALHFIHRVFTVSDGVLTQEEDSTVIIIDVDLSAPAAPTTAPTVTAGDAKLRLTAEYTSEVPAEWEFCACSSITSADITECTTCETVTTIPSEGLEFTDGIINGTTYEIVYRVADEAGNRSDPSPVARGTPTDLYDFAEVYESWSHGRGETGGCAVGDDDASPLAWLALFLVAGGVVLRRRHS